MSRYIDAEALEKRRIDYIVDGYADSVDDMVEWGMAIIEAPSIDIVRCKECRWGKPYSDKQLECDALGLGGLKFPDDYCSYGERSNK